jgi:superfamily II DNA or RNA helicase
MHIQIVTEDDGYMRLMREEFTRYVEGFRFMPQYKSGGWNGKTCMINSVDNTLPYGLLADFVRIHKKIFKRHKLVVEKDVLNLFKKPILDPTYDLNLFPYPYQADCIEASLRYSKGIIRSATASGKSLVISYILKTLLERKEIEQSIIIVPSKGLVEQFYNDMIEYGINEDIIGRVWAKSKEWDKPIVISTWQTLSRSSNKISLYQAVIVDEVHGAKAFQLKKLLAKSRDAQYRIGFTGTLHSTTLDNWNVKSFLGPIIREYSSGLLAELGYISKCTVKMLNVEYNRDVSEWEGTYNDVKDEVFTNPFRIGLMTDIVNELDHNVLILVGKVKKEGDYLLDILKKSCDKEVVFLSGKDDVDVRERWRKKCMDGKKKIISFEFNNIIVEVDIDSSVLLSNGSSKKASDITINDDIDDDWIKLNIDKKIKECKIR